MADDQVMRRQPSRAQWLRRLASRRKDPVAFVFSGGGPLGAEANNTTLRDAAFDIGVDRVRSAAEMRGYV